MVPWLVELAVGPGDLATRDRDHRRAQASKTLEHIVVDAAQLAFGGDGFGCRWIPHHDVGVRARIDAPLSRIDIEDAGDIGRGHGDEFFPRQSPGIDACGPQ